MDSDFSTWWTETLPLLEAGESLSGKQWALVRRRVAAFAASLKAPVDDARERNRRDAFVKWWAEFDAAAGDRPTLGEWSAFAGAVSGFVKGKTWAVCPPVNDTSMDLDVENKGDEIVAGVMAPTGDDDETVLDDPVVPETDHTGQQASPASPVTPTKKRPNPFISPGYGSSALKRFRWQNTAQQRMTKHFVADLITPEIMANFGSQFVADSTETGNPDVASKARRRSARVAASKAEKERQNDPAVSVEVKNLLSDRVADESLLIPFGWLQIDLRDDENQEVEMFDLSVWDFFGVPREKMPRDRILELNEFYRNEQELARLRERYRRNASELAENQDAQQRTLLEQQKGEVESRMDEVRGRQVVLETKYTGQAPMAPGEFPPKPDYNPKNHGSIDVTILWDLPPESKKREVNWEIVLAKGLETDGNPQGYLSRSDVPPKSLVLRSPIESKGKNESWIPVLRVFHEKKYLKLHGTLEFDECEGLFLRIGVYLTGHALRYGTDPDDNGTLTLDVIPADDRKMGTIFEELVDQTRLMAPYLSWDSQSMDEYFRSTRTYYTEQGLADTLPKSIAGMLESTRPPLDAEEAAVPEGLAPETTLLPYQLRNLAWMLKKEDPDHHPDKDLLHPSWMPVMVSKSKWEGIRTAKGDNMADDFEAGLTGDVILAEKVAAVELAKAADLQVVYLNEVTGTLSQRRFTVPQPSPGGILADEMGTGKTVEMISLILANPRDDLQGLNPRAGYDHVAEWLGVPEPDVLPVKATLIVVPKNLLDQWTAELEMHAPGLRVKQYVRTVKTVGAWWTPLRRVEYAAREFSEYDIVITSNDQIPKESLELETVQWWRIIIDEAQSIRNEANDLAARVSLLHRVNSWVVTGTPIYSDINDLSGYFAFLDVDPFWDKDVFTFSVVDPYLDERNQKGVLRVHGLLPKIMRRYSKAHLAEEFRVPPMTEVELLVTLSEREAWHYGAARKLAGRSFDRFLKDIAMNRSRKLSQEQVRHLNNSIQDLRHRACVSVDVAGKPRIQELRVETDAVKQLPLNEIYQLAQAERYRAQSSRRHDAIRAASVYLAAASAHRKDGHNEMLDADFGENESEDAALLADAVDILLSALRDGNITCLSTDTPWDLIRSTIRGTLAGGALAESRTWTAELLKLDGLVAERGAKRSVRSIAFPHVRKAAKSFDKARKALTRAQERVNHVEHVIATNIEVPDTCQNCNEIMSGCVISLCCSLQPYACFACYQTWRAKQAKAQCLFCREPIRTDQLVIVRSESEAFHPDDLVQNLPEPEFAEEAPLVSRYGSKIAAVVDDLSRRFSADPASKAIIFSQFKDVLEETRDALAESEILAVEYTAGEKLRQALRSIREDPNVRVILMPLRGLNAAGLTLTCCDVVYLMEPTIVPGLEDQAVNRIHRMGQTRRTTFVRVIAKGTVDRGIVQIQKEKREHSANGGGSGNVREKRADFGLVEWTRLFKHEEVEAGPSGV